MLSGTSACRRTRKTSACSSAGRSAVSTRKQYSSDMPCDRRHSDAHCRHPTVRSDRTMNTTNPNFKNDEQFQAAADKALAPKKTIAQLEEELRVAREAAAEEERAKAKVIQEAKWAEQKAKEDAANAERAAKVAP